MRNIELFGNLGSEPELKQDKNNNNFYVIRIGNTEYNDQETYWFTAYISRQDLFRIVPHLKKGSSVFIRGEYKDGIYKNENTGNCVIDRKIFVNEITFLGTSRSNSNNSQQDNTKSVPQDVVQQPKQVATTQTPVSSTNVVIDDLPF